VTVAALGPDAAGDAVVRLPTGAWRDVLTDDRAPVHVAADPDSDVAVAAILGGSPVAVLERIM
jgi:hypothetical protein